MGKESVNNKLTDNLIRLQIYGNEELENIKDSVLKQLFSIETYLSYCEVEAAKAKEIHSSLNLTLRGIAKHTNISKSSIYNSPEILKKYIELRVAEIETSDLFSKEKIQSMENKIKELQSFVESTQIDIVNYNLMVKQNSDLVKEINTLNKKVQALEEERNLNTALLNEKEMELRKYKNTGKVMNFKK